MAPLHKNHPKVLEIHRLDSNGMAQKQIAHVIGISHRAVNYWLNHQRELELNRRRKAITVSDTTLKRFNEMLDKYDADSADRMLNRLMSAYEQVTL